MAPRSKPSRATSRRARSRRKARRRFFSSKSTASPRRSPKKRPASSARSGERARRKSCTPATGRAPGAVARPPRAVDVAQDGGRLSSTTTSSSPRHAFPRFSRSCSASPRNYRLRIPCFGHAGDGNIHVNIMVDPADAGEIPRAHEAERVLFEGVVAMEGSISGEHGIGFAKARVHARSSSRRMRSR